MSNTIENDINVQTHRLNIQDKLPLTCSRTGTCCHGKLVQLNPWELFCLAKEKNISPGEFRDLYCESGGIKLRFNGEAGWKGLVACSQYIVDFGCSVYHGRPLSCRLYPLGRQKQSSETYYMYQGKDFPCLEGCPEVTGLPQLSVGEFVKGQLTKSYENAQDEYLEMMQDLADGAFVLLLDSGLSDSGDRKTLGLWKKMGKEKSEQLADRIGSEWVDSLMLPGLDLTDPIAFSRQHNNILQLKVQEAFGDLKTNQKFHEASCIMMGLALLLGQGLGANPITLAELWINTAKKHGALD